MKNILTGLILLASPLVLMAQDETSQTDPADVGYMLGMDVGNSLRQFDGKFDLEKVIEGMRDTLTGSELKMSPEQAREVKKAFFTVLQAEKQREQELVAGKNREEGQAYLRENAKRKGVVTTASGLQYEVLTEGSGEKPGAVDQVKVHYKGTLIDGTEFDSSYSRGEPIVLSLNGVIKGWTEALQLMPVGSKYRLVIPSELAYGSRGTPGPIGPDATLIFEVELLEIVK